MKIFVDIFGKKIRLTEERLSHFKSFHPEMKHQLRKIKKTLLSPELVLLSKSDKNVQLYYNYFGETPVGSKYLCIVVKSIANDYFILTAYFTDAIKRGDLVWTKTNK